MEFLPIILRSSFVSCSLINLDFLLPQSAQFDESIILLGFFVSKALGFLFSVIFQASNNTITLLYLGFKILINH